MAGGYLCFVICIVFIGIVITVVGDVSSALGCTVGLKDSVTAVAFIAIGTCLPGKKILNCIYLSLYRPFISHFNILVLF